MLMREHSSISKDKTVAVCSISQLARHFHQGLQNYVRGCSGLIKVVTENTCVHRVVISGTAKGGQTAQKRDRFRRAGWGQTNVSSSHLGNNRKATLERNVSMPAPQLVHLNLRVEIKDI